MSLSLSNTEPIATVVRSEVDKYIDCYIHSVSPVKRKAENNRKYFYCSLQAKEKSYRAICFSPEKQSELSTLGKLRSPVKLQNFKLYDNKDILLGKHTDIRPIDKESVGFQPVTFTNTGLIENIAALNKLASEQLVSLKAEAVYVYGVK